MRNYKKIEIMIVTLIVTFLISLSMAAHAGEPKKPEVNKTFNQEKEARINSIAGMSTIKAYKALKSPDVTVNRDMMNKTIFKAFGHRRSEAITRAQNYLKLPLREVINGKVVDNTRELNFAKRIFEVFPEEAADSLILLYKNGDSETRSNIILASGNIAGGPAIKGLLVNALDDKTFTEYEENDPELLGAPLRVCDDAYNQLVLRYRIRNVLRTISPAHRVEIRDYHINILKARL